MQKERFRRRSAAGSKADWADLLCALAAPTEIEIENGGKRFLGRSRAKGAPVTLLRCLGARRPIPIRRINPEPGGAKELPVVAGQSHPNRGYTAKCGATRPESAHTALIRNPPPSQTVDEELQ